MIRTLKRQWLWVFYAIFVVIALATHAGEPIFYATGPYAAGKYVIWILFFLFLAYSIYCSTQASFIKVCRRLINISGPDKSGLTSISVCFFRSD